VPCSGLRVAKRAGDPVKRGETLAEAVGATPSDALVLARAFTIAHHRIEPPQLIVETLSGSPARSTSAIR
jgi:hypothetical protein